MARDVALGIWRGGTKVEDTGFSDSNKQHALAGHGRGKYRPTVSHADRRVHGRTRFGTWLGYETRRRGMSLILIYGKQYSFVNI